MISPRLSPGLAIPCDQYDEWYVFSDLPADVEITTRYVNYGGFNLADPAELAASQDSTWCRANYDWLVPFQARFWDDLDRIRPTTYVASGDRDVVVTSDVVFARTITAAALRVAG